jgi:CheY-like chemotaxis protein
MTQKHSLESPGYIVVIESNAVSAAAIQRALDAHLPAQLVIVTGVEEALAFIATHVPDVILTTTFLAPADDMKLRDHLRRNAGTSHTQVVTLPQFIESVEPDANTKPLSGSGAVLGRRQTVVVQRCDARMLREQVQQYLEQAQALRRHAEDRQQCGLAGVFAADIAAVRPQETWPTVSPSTALVLANRSESRALASTFSLPRDRRRASRKKAADLGDAWGIALPDGEGRVLDISSLGVLAETSSYLPPGRIVGLKILGLERTLSVTARLVRSGVADRSGPDVRYRVAAAFVREIDLFPVNAPRSPVSHSPKVLADLLGRVLAGANWASNGAALRSAFETELARLLPVQEVRIRLVAIVGPHDCESVCFDIPGDGDFRFRLQAIFEPRYQPTALDLRLLKAAADLATVVVALAPLSEPTAARA